MLSVIFTSKQTTEKDQICDYQRQRVQRREGLDEGDHKVQTFSYKISTRGVMYTVRNKVNTVVCCSES